jgi:hypothetical protein
MGVNVTATQTNVTNVGEIIEKISRANNALEILNQRVQRIGDKLWDQIYGASNEAQILEDQKPDEASLANEAGRLESTLTWLESNIYRIEGLLGNRPFETPISEFSQSSKTKSR